MKFFIVIVLFFAGCSQMPVEKTTNIVEQTDPVINEKEILTDADDEAVEEPSLKTAIGQTISAYLSEEGFNGAALVAIDGEVILEAGFGWADKEERIKMPADGIFQIASLSKSFAAVSILQLVEEGYLSLEDTLDRFFPHLDRAEEMTIHHLLTHSSGLFAPDSVAAFDYSSYKPGQLQFTFTPQIRIFEDIGEQTRYSNVGYDLLGAIVEQISGLAYGEYLKENIFGPLGLEATRLGHPKEAVTAYMGNIDDLVLAPPLHPAFAFASGGISSTVGDLFLYIQGLLASETLLTFESFQQMSSPHQKVGRSYHGYGFFIDARATANTISHTGFLHGWHSALVQELDNRATVILLSNQGSSEGMEKAFIIANLILAEEI